MAYKYFFDAGTGVLETSVEIGSGFIYHRYFTGKEETRILVGGTFDYGIGVNLIYLVPQKFQSSPLLQDYIKQLDIVVGSSLSKARDLDKLVDPWRAPDEYLVHLSSLIGVEIEDDPLITTLETRRNQVLSAIDWIKIKGTYLSLKYVADTCGVTANIYDLYTKNYSTFVREDWFVGEEDENPAGLDSSYYKSPHFVFEISLNKVYDVGVSSGSGYGYLFRSNVGNLAYKLLEKTRPINTVPHYSLLLNAVTIEDYIVYVTDAYVKTIVTNDWFYVFRYFDTTPAAWTWDDGTAKFDSSYTAFLNSITKWKIGDGNKGISPDESGFTLSHVVASGTVDGVEIFDDRAEFSITIPTGVAYLDLSELGLFLGDNTTMVAASTFPDIDKSTTFELVIKVSVYKV